MNSAILFGTFMAFLLSPTGIIAAVVGILSTSWRMKLLSAVLVALPLGVNAARNIHRNAELFGYVPAPYWVIMTLEISGYLLIVALLSALAATVRRIHLRRT